MEAKEKLARALQDDWEIHGDPKQLCGILRDEIRKRRMNQQEKEVMDHLTAFWNSYIKLGPSAADPLCRDVANAVHVIQGIMAVRVAARCDPTFG